MFVLFLSFKYLNQKSRRLYYASANLVMRVSLSKLVVP
jgi:hypothetical protein